VGHILTQAWGGHSDAIQSLASLISVLAIIPSAIIFIINQIYQNALLRENKHKYVTERYEEFLNLCLLYPELRLGYGMPVAVGRLTKARLYQRDILFELLTSIFESAYLTYSNRINSSRSQQWGGWEDYIAHFTMRSDYQEWWIRVVQDGDFELTKEGTSQYDLRFERYMFSKFRGRLGSGQLEAIEERKPVHT